ncbi:O-antigen ligase family protein [Candidatus Roizmanbacteria bacterium]|nr:O-antigen ligase family protein [Candidatus Roizmanbacteria bacterium]
MVLDKYFTWPKKTATKKIISAPPTGPKLLITESLDLRKIVWQGALDLGKLHPLFGTGVETFAYSYFFVRPVSHNLTSEWDFIYNKAHNEYLNYLATTGFVGLFTYLFLIAVVLFHLLKKTIKKDKLSFYLFLAYCSILFTNFFGFATSSVTLFFYFIPAFWYISTNQGSPPVNPTPRRSFSPKDYMLSFIVLLVSVSLLWYLINYYRGDVLFAKANQQIKNENYPQAVQLLQRAIQLHDEHVYEDKYAFMLANTAYVAAYNKQDETAKQLMKLADYSSRKSIKASPENMNYWKTRSKIYYIFYQLTLEKKYLEEGVGALTQAKILAPSDPRPSYSLALYYSLLESEADGAKNQNMYRQLAFSEIDRALVLKPNYYEASLLKGQLLKKINQPEAARAVFQKMLAQFGSDEAILDELKSLYTTRK